MFDTGVEREIMSFYDRIYQRYRRHFLFYLSTTTNYSQTQKGLSLSKNEIRKFFQRVQWATAAQELDICTVSLDLSHLSTSNILVPIKRSEPPLFRDYNLLTTWEFVL